MTIDEASRALNGHLIGASLATLGQRFLLSGGTRPEDLQLQMQYMAALMTDPALRANEFNKAIASAPMGWARSEEHTSELQSLMRISYAVFCLKKKKTKKSNSDKQTSSKKP